MLIRSYINALLIDEWLADLMSYLWASSVLNDDRADACWRAISARFRLPRKLRKSGENLGTI